MERVSRPEVLNDVDPSRLLDLDVRADLRTGSDPFQRIMHARQALAGDGVLRIRAIFEPKPLYEAMAREGFEHWTEELAEDDWRIWFYRDADAVAVVPSSDDAESPVAEFPTTGPLPVVGGQPRRSTGPSLPNCATPRPEPADITVLDVRGMEPPEPMEQTLAALEALPVGDTLVHVNVRVPQLLLPRLKERGFAYTVREEDGTVRLFIRHATEIPVLDVRILPPKEKHPTIFETFDALEPGSSFVLLNDHDPVPLRYQFEGERPDRFTWVYLEQGPDIWRVEIGRLA